MTATDEPLIRDLTKRAENALRPRIVKLLGAAHSNHRDVVGLAEAIIDMISRGWSIDLMIGQLKPMEEGLRNYPFYILQPIEEVVHSVAETLDFVTLQQTMWDLICDENDPTRVSMAETVGRIERV